MSAYIRGVSYYLPEEQLTNEALSELFSELSPSDIYKRTGVRSRHIASSEQISSDLALESAKKLFVEYAIQPDDIDFLIVCVELRDYITPPTACLLQQQLGLPTNVGAIDLPLGCTGFVYGLSMAKALLEMHNFENVLLLTADVTTKVIHPYDKELRMIFGDGAATTLISNNSKVPHRSIRHFVYGTDGKGAKNLKVERGGGRKPIDAKWLNEHKVVGGMPYGMLHMSGVEMFVFVINVIPTMVKDLLKKEECDMDSIDLFIFHQANAYLLEVLRKKMDIPEEKFFVWMESVGNTVSASIPIALKEAMKQGKAKPGSKILLASFGIGYSWSGTIINL